MKWGKQMMSTIDESEIRDHVFIVITTVLGISRDEISLEAHFRNDLGADSLDLVAMIVELGKIFDVQVCDVEVRKIATVGETVTYLLHNISLSFESRKTISQYSHFINLKEISHG